MVKKFWTHLLNLLVIVGLGAASGALGAALAVRSATNVSEIILAGEIGGASAPRAGSTAKMDAVSSTVRSSVVFYRNHLGVGIDGVFLPTDIVGEGVVLTADGWVATDQDVFSGHDQLVAVFGDGREAIVPADKVVSDDATGLAFVRLGVDHLNVAPFGDDTALVPGENVYVVKGTGLNVFPVFAVRELPVTVRADLVESSEKFSRRLVLGNANLDLGAPVIDSSGNVVALGAGGNAAVPAEYFAGAMKEIFLGQKIIRPILGVHYLSVADAAASSAAGIPAEGALIIGSGKIKAVSAGSPAEAGGLHDGDVIVAVERDRIAKDTPLAEIISEYSPGAKIELTVLRLGKQIKLSVTLK
jgi:S1-C subfamily serine protease